MLSVCDYAAMLDMTLYMMSWPARLDALSLHGTGQARMLINTSATFKKCAKRLLPFIVGIFAANLDAGIPAEIIYEKYLGSSWCLM